jgi:hypothetical protein
MDVDDGAEAQQEQSSINAGFKYQQCTGVLCKDLGSNFASHALLGSIVHVQTERTPFFTKS